MKHSKELLQKVISHEEKNEQQLLDSVQAYELEVESRRLQLDNVQARLLELRTELDKLDRLV